MDSDELEPKPKKPDLKNLEILSKKPSDIG